MTEPPANNRGGRPVADPTVLTTEALQREVATLRELVELRVAALQELTERTISGIVEVREEEFRGVKDKLGLVEQQRVEQKADTKAAVDAALTAQKEAVASQTDASERSIAKSEAATTKAIEQLGTTFNTVFDGQRREVSDLKDRVGAIEQRRVSGQEAKASTGDYTARLIAAAGVFVALVVGVLVVMSSSGSP